MKFSVLSVFASSTWGLLWLFSGPAFGQIDLEKAFSLAIENHKRIEIAATEVAKNKLLPKKARTLLMPRLGIEGSYRKANDPIEFEAQIGGFTAPPIETVPEEQWEGHFNFTQPIYEAEYFPLKRKSHQLIEGSAEYYCQTIQDILFRVARAYYQVFKAEELLKNAKEIVSLDEEALRVARVKHDSGDVTEDVVLRAELNLSRAESNVIKNTNQLKLSEDYLKRLIGVEEKELHLLPPPEKMKAHGSFEELIQTAMDNRYDYKMALMNIKVAETDIDVAKARFHPRFQGTWDYYRIDDPSFLQEDDYWVAGVKLEIPIFDGGMKSLNLKEEREDLKQAKLEVEDLKTNIIHQVEDAFLKESTGRSVLRNAKEQVRLAEKTHEITFSKFRFGAATILELNEATALLDSANTGLITSKYDYQIDLLMLEVVTGVFAREYIEESRSFLRDPHGEAP